MRVGRKPLTTLVDRDFFHVLFITLGYVDMGYESQKYGFFFAAENFFLSPWKTPRESLNHDDKLFTKKVGEPQNVPDSNSGQF